MGADISKDKIRKAYQILSSASKDAYKDIFLVSNEALSKNPFNSGFLDHFLSDDEPPSVPAGAIIYKFLLYYLKSLLQFILYLSRFVEYRLSAFKFYFSVECKELVLIDVVFLMEKIERARSFSDSFMPGLEGLLKKEARHYAYLPSFYSSSYNKKPMELYRTLRILKAGKVPILSEFQLLTISDLLYLLYFIAAYPFHVFKFAMTLNSPDPREAKLLRWDLLNTISHVTFYSFSRYLLGRRIAGLPYEKIRVISWYENRPVYKNLYSGLRANASKVRIYGAQLFLYSKNYLTIIPDENEARFGVIPDKIVTNGPYYIPEKSRLNYAVGPSLRYAKIFSAAVRKEGQKDILVLLPYPIENGESILQMLFDEGLKPYNVVIKAHPGVNIRQLKARVPPRMTIKEEDTYKLFESAKIVIGTSSGTLIEAASLGIPTISVKTNKRFDYHSPLPERGKGLIWEEVSDVNGLIQQVEKFESILNNRPEEIRAISSEYKRMFFCEASEENIKMAFDL